MSSENSQITGEKKKKKKKKKILYPEKKRNLKKKLEDSKKKKNQKKRKKDQAKEEPDKATIKYSSFGGLLGRIKKLKKIFRQNKGADAHLMARTRSNPLAKGKTKVYRPPTRASPRLASLKSQGTVQPQFQAPAAPVENIATSILLPKKRPTYRMAGEGSSKVCTKAPCRRSQGIAALHHAKNQATEEHEVIALSSDSEHEKDKNLEVGTEEALLAAEDGADETLP
ncbi:hypothetical protein PIB30_077549 [Stylosanthes scabra]|uniref:Uncharacterized protein n=1 Tax=Stylosanthes scabra TaxID=79078 RepID=A0ABU6RQT6_9FABA|nr:hypothetical protein [Stylosanthes scabra]